MLGGKELKGLELRRRELVLQSTLNRLALRMELHNLQTALRPADRVVSSVRAAGPWLMVLAPLAGIIAARGLRGNGSGFSKLIGLLKYLQPILALWKQFKTASGEATEVTAAPAAERD